MSLLTGKRPASDDVRRIALAALTAALDDGGGQPTPKRFKGVRALAAGAAIYTAGVAVFKNRDAILDRLREEDEDFDDEEYEEEPVAEEDLEEDDDEEEDEPEDEGEEDFDEEDDDEADNSAGSRPPVHADRGSPDDDPEIPEPPTRPRAPVGRR